MNTAQQLADAGCQLVLFNEPEEWKVRFIAFCEERARHLPFFKIEDMRSDWLGQGHPAPHSPKVYGAIAREIVKRGIAVFDGYVKSVSPKTHSHPVAKYRSLKFKGVTQ